MTMPAITTPRSEFLDGAAWRQGKSGVSWYRAWRGLHVSVYRKPHSHELRFRIDGGLGTLDLAAAMRRLWFRWLSLLEDDGDV
jgi:hypothetical protein